MLLQIGVYSIADVIVMPEGSKCKMAFLSYLDRHVLTTLHSRYGEAKRFPQCESLELGRTMISGLHVKEQQSL